MALDYTTEDRGRVLTYPNRAGFPAEGDRIIKAYIAMDTGQAYVWMPDGTGNTYRAISSPKTPNNPYVFQGVKA